ncbi:response regulator transcription factor [Shimia haliotis]|uniref:Two-component system, OmpR family, response regulator ChvI n=1 Tax=Shimia haliotis TaxID=1280847 RepID=A0A1I3ZZF4_9RHOB|nr:response regulator transcription factor [Shimia haliotis]SFK49247.1 two-component system, OmpR family, response regulator ChvI [Shimia haliotis]
MAQIIILDDNRPTLNDLTRLLESDGHRILPYVGGALAMRDIGDPKTALLIMNTRPRGIDGMDLLRRIRSRFDLPVMLLSDARSDAEEAFGLHMGADDYVRKPYAPRVMLERVRALLRRGRIATPAHEGVSKLVKGPLVMDKESHEVTWHGRLLELTATEFNVLWALAKRPGMVLERAKILETAYGTDLGVTDRCIDSQIKRLRMKLRRVDPNFDAIETLYGLGYRFIERSTSQAAA